ncbi:MAG: hypothetical protein ACR2JD_01520 [Nocardioides sp.]
MFADERLPKPKREFRLPTLAAPVAAAVTGLVVGAFAVALTWLSLRGCEVVSGTSSCGNPGLLLLLLVVGLLGLLGAVLLGALGVEHAGSTSALAVALLAAVAMLFLIDVLFAWWMILVIPVVALATYALAQAVTDAAGGKLATARRVRGARRPARRSARC